jgi:hypothetical protein
MGAVGIPTQAIARVQVQPGGTAFAVSDGLALTAFHVVGNRASGTISQAEVLLDFMGARVAASVDPLSDPLADVALLRLGTSVPANFTPIHLTLDVRREDWLSRGFPRADPTATGVTIDGTIVDLAQRQPHSQARVISLYCRQAAAESPQRLAGFSGAPVLSASSCLAVGLIRWSPVDRNRPEVATGGTVYACPAQSIVAIWPELMAYVRVNDSEPSRSSEPDHVKRLIEQQEKNLRTTEAQAAKYSRAELPLHLRNQMEDITDELTRLRARLEESS